MLSQLLTYLNNLSHLPDIIHTHIDVHAHTHTCIHTHYNAIPHIVVPLYYSTRSCFVYQCSCVFMVTRFLVSSLLYSDTLVHAYHINCAIQLPSNTYIDWRKWCSSCGDLLDALNCLDGRRVVRCRGNHYAERLDYNERESVRFVYGKHVAWLLSTFPALILFSHSKDLTVCVCVVL